MTRGRGVGGDGGGRGRGRGPRVVNALRVVKYKSCTYRPCPDARL